MRRTVVKKSEVKDCCWPGRRGTDRLVRLGGGWRSGGAAGCGRCWSSGKSLMCWDMLVAASGCRRQWERTLCSKSAYKGYRGCMYRGLQGPPPIVPCLEPVSGALELASFSRRTHVVQVLGSSQSIPVQCEPGLVFLRVQANKLSYEYFDQCSFIISFEHKEGQALSHRLPRNTESGPRLHTTTEGSLTHTAHRRS